MRIAYNGLFLRRPDGTGRYSREILAASAALETHSPGETAHDWHVVSVDEPDPLGDCSRTPSRTTTHALHSPMVAHGENLTKLWFEQRGVTSVVEKVKADLTHYPYFAAPLAVTSPVVVTVHDVIPLILPEYRGSTAVRVYMQLQAVAVRKARLILTDSNTSKHDIVRHLGIPRQKVRVIPLGVGPEYHPIEPSLIEPLRAKYKLPERYVLYAGGLDVRKNVERLILAYARARASQGVSEPLVITGNPDRSGALFTPLRPIVNQLGLDRHVRFIGTVPLDELPTLFAGSSLFVYPSRYEGFGLPVLEAMACGVVVACSNTSSVGEIAGNAALTFEPDDEGALADALARGLRDDALRATLRTRGLAHAALFTWEKTAKATLRAYQDALEG